MLWGWINHRDTRWHTNTVAVKEQSIRSPYSSRSPVWATLPARLAKSGHCIDAVRLLRYGVAMTKIEVRTDKTLKRDVQHILADLGLDLSTAVNMFLVQIRLRKGIPFPIVTENGFTEAEEKAMLREVKDAERNGKTFSSVEELHRDILGT